MYKLQNRYKDESWQDLEGEEFSCIPDACRKAKTLSNNSICYGMVRVVRSGTNEVIVTYPAGGDTHKTHPILPEDKRPKKEEAYDYVRAGFEKWTESKKEGNCPINCFMFENNEYKYQDTRKAWEVWQAACGWKVEQQLKSLTSGNYSDHMH